MPNPTIAGAGKLLEAIALLESLLTFGERFSKHGGEIQKLILLLEQSSLVEQAQKIDATREKIRKLEEEIKKEEKELASLPQAKDVGGSYLLAPGEIRRAQQESVIQTKKSELQGFEKDLQDLHNEFQKGLDKVAIEAEKKRGQVEYETERARLERTIKDENQLRLALLDLERDYLRKKVDQEFGQVRELYGVVKDLKLAIDNQYLEEKSQIESQKQAKKNDLLEKEQNLKNGGQQEKKIPKKAELAEIVVTDKGRSLEPIRHQPDIGPPKFSKVSTVPPEQTKKKAKETFSELAALNESFHNSFNAGMQAIGQSINQSIGGMFRGVFGEANSLLEIFIANFVTSMASNVLSLLTGGASGGVLSILGFAKGGVISEPIFGIGKSGQRYLFGEAGKEAVLPISNMANMAAAQAAQMNGLENSLAQEIRSMRRTMEAGQWRLKGRDLVYSVDGSNRVLNRRTL